MYLPIKNYYETVIAILLCDGYDCQDNLVEANVYDL